MPFKPARRNAPGLRAQWEQNPAPCAAAAQVPGRVGDCGGISVFDARHFSSSAMNALGPPGR